MEIIKFIFIKKKSYLLINTIVLLLGIIGMLLSFILSGNISLVAMSISTSLISGAVIAFLNIWRTASNDVIFSDIDELVLKAGVEKAYKKRDLDEYDALLNSAQSIDIAGYSLRAFLQSYQNLITNTLSQKNGFRLRAILVDPNSEISKSREKLEHGDHRDIFKSACEDFSNALNDVNGVEIRYIDCALSTMIYRIDDVMFVGPQFAKEASKASFTMRLKRGGWAFSQYDDEFSKLWELGRTTVSG